MADHFIGLNRGVTGTWEADFNVGTVSQGTDIELRLADAAALTRKDIILALDSFERFMNTRELIVYASTPFSPV
jgi:hypothetical protein